MLWNSVQILKKCKPASHPELTIIAWSLLSTGIALKTMDWIHMKNMNSVKKK